MKKIFFTILVLSAAVVYGQTAYKDSLVREVDNYVNSTNKAAAIFLNKKLSAAERIHAIESYAVIYDDKQAEQFKIIALDETELPEVRAMALNKIHSYAAEDDKLTAFKNELLGNAKEPKVLRDEALDLEEDITFASMDVPDVYQKMLTDPEPDFRLFAFSKLITHGDARAQLLLIKGLENPQVALLPAPAAIEVLSMAVKKEYYPTLYKVLQQTKDEATRLEAIRNLGFYKAARPAIISISLDKNEKEEFREAALDALYAGDRDHIVNYVLPVLADKTAAPRLQAIGIQMTIDVRQNMKYRINAKKADKFDLLIKSQSEDKSKPYEVHTLCMKYIERVRPKY